MPNAANIQKVISKNRDALSALKAFDDIAETRIKGKAGVLVALKHQGLVTKFKASRILRGTPVRFVVLGESHSIGSSNNLVRQPALQRLFHTLRGLLD